jgi:membrane protease YdiL (CAAX protease family)
MYRAWLQVLLLISPLLVNDVYVILWSDGLPVWAQWLVDFGSYALAIWPAAVLLLVCRFGVRNLLLGNLFPETWQYYWTFPDEQPFRLLVVVYAAATAGFFEEIVFRGFVTEKLRQITSRRVGAFLSALLFAAIHWCQGPQGLLTALVFALLIQAFYDIYGNMRSTILVHVLYDLWVFF